MERRADHRLQHVEQRAGDLGRHPADQLDDEDRVSHPGLAQPPDDASGGCVFFPADQCRGGLLVQGETHVGAAERLGDGHGQRRLAGPAGPGKAREARRGPGRAWQHDQGGSLHLRSLATARRFHGEQPADPRVRREHFDEAGLDALAAAVRPIQRLLQINRVEP